MKRLTFILAVLTASLVVAVQPTAPQYIPNPSVTPGEVDPRLTDAVLTDPTFRTGEVRNVTLAMRRKAFANYGLDYDHVNHADYELDHFISIGIGGASTVKNLWPEPHHLNVGGFDVGSFTKDKLEGLLVRLVRARRITPAEARREEANDWTIAYIHYFGSLPRFR